MIYLLVGSWEKRWNWNIPNGWSKFSLEVISSSHWLQCHALCAFPPGITHLFCISCVEDGIFINFIYLGFAFRYMSSSLLKVAQENSSVVAVVGKGHLQGIQKYWKQPVEVSDIFPWNTMKALPSYLPRGWKLSFWSLLASFWY